MMMKSNLVEEHNLFCLICSWSNKGVHAFPKGIRVKVNVIARLEFELTYNSLSLISALKDFSGLTAKGLKIIIRGSLNRFPDFIRMGTFIDSTYMKL